MAASKYILVESKYFKKGISTNVKLDKIKINKSKPGCKWDALVIESYTHLSTSKLNVSTLHLSCI